MAKTNLAQHEQHLKSLETSIKEICDKHREVNDVLHDSWNMLNEMWSMTLKLFVVVEDVRQVRLEFEKNSQESWEEQRIKSSLMTDTQCLMLGLFIRCFFPQRRKIRSALPFINRENLSLSTLFPCLDIFAREKNKNLQVVSEWKCRQARLHVAKNFATIALTQASMIGACTQMYKLIFEFV